MLTEGGEGCDVMASWLDGRKGATWRSRETATMTIAEKVERGQENERTFIERRETKGGWSREGVIGQDERRRGGGFIAGI